MWAKAKPTKANLGKRCYAVITAAESAEKIAPGWTGRGREAVRRRREFINAMRNARLWAMQAQQILDRE